MVEEIDGEYGLGSFLSNKASANDRWARVTSETRCTCLFIEYVELEESQALVSSNIPLSR